MRAARKTAFLAFVLALVSVFPLSIALAYAHPGFAPTAFGSITVKPTLITQRGSITIYGTGWGNDLVTVFADGPVAVQSPQVSAYNGFFQVQITLATAGNYTVFGFDISTGGTTAPVAVNVNPL